MPDLMIRELPGAIPPSEQTQRIEANDLTWPENVGEDKTWLQIVLQDVERTEGFLVSRQYTRAWDLGDRLYYAYVAPANWPGTETPRAALGMPLLATELFEILSNIVQAFFSGNKPIQIDPRRGTSTETAEANQALLMWELEQCKFRLNLVYFLFDMFLYGTGNGWWGFQPMTRRKRKKIRRAVAPVLGEQKSDVASRDTSPLSGLSGSGQPATGTAVQSDASSLSALADNPSARTEGSLSGPPEMELVTEEHEETWVVPKFEYSHIRFYGVSPSCRQMDITTAPYAYRRMYLSVTDLDDLRNVDGYQNIPTREQLEKLVTPDKEQATPAPTEMGTFQNTINLGKKSLPRWMDSTTDPLKQGFEVIEYWTPDRVVATFERQLVIRNATHDFREIPSRSCAMQISPDSYYGLGLTHLVGNFQSVMQGTVNLYLDDLVLRLNQMFTSGKGFNTPGQAIWASPGKVVKVDDAQQFQPIKRESVGADAMGTIAACQGWAKQASGTAEIAPEAKTPGKPATLTARLEFIIDNIADLVIIPLVQKFIDLNFDNLSPEQIETILGDELGHEYNEDPLNLVNGSYKVSISAGARLAARDAIAQQWPLIMNMITSPSVLMGLQTEAKKLNYSWIVKQTFEAAGYPGETDCIIPQTPDDIERTKAMNPAMNRLQLQQEKIEQETQGQMEIEEGKAGGRMLLAVTKHALKQDGLPALGG